MLPATLVLSSAGSLAVSVFALLFAVMQMSLALKRSEFSWNRWGAAVSVSTSLYAFAVFIQYNTSAGTLNLVTEKVQFTSFLMLIHSIYGFTFSFLSRPASGYHRFALPLHFFLLVLVWLPGVMMGNAFVHRPFLLLARPYVEPVLNPLGVLFLLYVVGAGIYAFFYWTRSQHKIGPGRHIFISGICLWAVLAIHDAACTFGLQSGQFLLEYGFFGFSGALLYATVQKYIDLYDLAEKTRFELAEAKSDLENRVQERTAELLRSNEDLQCEITERKRVEQALRSNEQFLDDVIESIQDGISVLDKDLNIRHVNGVMKRWYARNQPLVGKKCFAAYRDADKPCDSCPTLRSLENRRTEREIVPGLPGSSVQWLELFSFPILDRQSGRITGVVEFVRDLTRQTQMEARLRQAERMDSIGRLAGGVAHDFNNLLMGIQGRTSLMLTDLPAGHPFSRHLRGIEATVQSASELTRQLLGVARGGKYSIQATDLNELIEETLTLFWRTRKEVLVEKDLLPGLWPVAVDQGQIRQVFLNLFVNAWEAMPQGGKIFIRTENRPIADPDTSALRLKPGNHIRASVSDTGLGMDRQTLGRIFDPFFTTKDISRGTGLGLASAYGIIKSHSGCIDVQSRPGKGTSFSIYLPVSDTCPNKKEADDEQNQTGDETILLVDDEAMILEIGEQLLAKLGYRVLTAASGKEALQRFKSASENIDLVILDLIMPGFSGGETFDALYAIDPAVRVLLSSGYSVDGEAEAILQRGCRGFIQKPFSISRLSRKIREVLDQKPSFGRSTVE